ncbi:PQQ-dependent sugar dehydrogenase [Membranicola marinus]|uniref:PQQ-dependent sugar dehydrogenase n=1 Tax=Membranihabitans marinus TaxID=1227546 RepID=A0A953LA01_9BACT|nr:PQQ-dependent sugar dehydrogenase [Membranihabitans marinus]MBY5959385.1 PQQ-dependent sugar dehydrogenase [Membranihabitans marinus]
MVLLHIVSEVMLVFFYSLRNVLTDMRYLSLLNKATVFCLIGGLFLFYSCTPKRSEVKVLLLASPQSLDSAVLPDIEAKDWKLTQVTPTAGFLNEDTLATYSAVLLRLSDLDDLYYRDRNVLERYVESGGGLVALIDTIKPYPVWKITKTLQELELNIPSMYGAGHVVLVPSHGQEGLVEALQSAVGPNYVVSFDDAITGRIPDSSRFSRQVLVQGMDEPMEMEILPNNDILMVERKGLVKLYDASEGEIRVIHRFDVFSGIEDGLLGMTIDPDFEENGWVYFYYAVGGDDHKNRLSRIDYQEGQLNLDSEKILLEIPMQRQYCCHSAGYLTFDSQGMLYLSTGDNTNAEEAEGYIPIDERPGRELADDQATAANTNDLRGKILRIKPEDDGTYSIPEGNLFPEGMANTRPEIYIMGCRNPYRFSVDKNGTVYWGDVGPYTKVQGKYGSLSYDEFNRADEPGFYGWPYFLGDNEAYPYYDFETKEVGPRFDPENPVNLSPNNTGLKELPLPQPAFIWYGSERIDRFPLVGQGGASGMAGPVYDYAAMDGAPFQLAGYYDGKLIIYEWIRNWFLVVEFDEEGEMVSMEPFLDQFDFSSPVDFKFGPDGAMYVLEYGSNWFSKNTDAKLVRIEYVEGNRAPEAVIEADYLVGAAPLDVQFDAGSSIDFDQDDQLSYVWRIKGEELSGVVVDYRFEEPGSYSVTLAVTDSEGASGETSVQVVVGNTPPEINLDIAGNKTFIPKNGKLAYSISGKDAEDGEIQGVDLHPQFGYLDHRADLALILSNSETVNLGQFSEGKSLIEKSDCQSCHHTAEKSVGPAYQDVAAKYQNTPVIVEDLAAKVIEGGSGNWGSRPMTPHPHLNEQDARKMIQYIMSLDEKTATLSPQGILEFDSHAPEDQSGGYVLMAEYTDQGGENDTPPLHTRSYNVWQSSRIEAESFDEGNVSIGTITTEKLSYIRGILDGSYVVYENIDLTDIDHLQYRIQANGPGGKISIHLDRIDGPVVSELVVTRKAGGSWDVYKGELQSTDSVHDLYIVFTNPDNPRYNLFNIDWVEFVQ